MPFINNLPQVKAQLEALVVKAEGLSLYHFRRAVWAVFCEILETTPQYSGTAVANWNIGVGAPDYSVDAGAGDKFERKTSANGTHYDDFLALHKGSRGWITFAKLKNEWKLARITSKTRVFISNGITGDTDDGKSSQSYLADLQSPRYWMEKLRPINKDYETLTEVILLESWRQRLPDSVKDARIFQ